MKYLWGFRRLDSTDVSLILPPHCSLASILQLERDRRRTTSKKQKMKFSRVLFSATLVAHGSSLAPPQRTPRASSSLPLAVASAGEMAANIDRDFYKAEKLGEEDYDAIVVGAGIGGLTTASLLGQEGKKVLVLEQHYVAGGTMHTFKQKGYEFATGIHYIGEMGPEKKPRRKELFRFKKILDRISPIDDPIMWDRLDDKIETIVLGEASNRHDVLVGEQAQIESLSSKFPDEVDAIENYFKHMRLARESITKAFVFKALPVRVAKLLVKTRLSRLFDRKYRRYATTTVKEMVESLTDNKELQAIFEYNWGDYGTEPSTASFFFHSLSQTHFYQGAFYPNGGPTMMTKKIIKEINNNGGKVLVKAPVQRIVLDDETKRVQGVELTDGKIIKSPVVVSNAGVINTVTKLLPPASVDIEFAKGDRYTVDDLRTGATGINLFVGLEGDHKSLNLPNCQFWVYPSNDVVGTTKRFVDMTLEEALEMDPKELSPVFISIPGAKDKNWAKKYPNKSVLEIITVCPWHWWNRKEFEYDPETRSRGPKYEAAKQKFSELMYARVVEVLESSGATVPKTLDEVDHHDLGTGLTFEYYYNAEKGALYGIDHNPKRFDPESFYLRLRPEVPEVPGLYLTGQDIATSSFVGAMCGGLLCSQKVLGHFSPLSLLRERRK